MRMKRIFICVGFQLKPDYGTKLTYPMEDLFQIIYVTTERDRRR